MTKTVEHELGPEFTTELHGLAVIMLVADKMADRVDGTVCIPAGWWDEHVAGKLARLNEIARAALAQTGDGP